MGTQQEKTPERVEYQESPESPVYLWYLCRQWWPCQAGDIQKTMSACTCGFGLVERLVPRGNSAVELVDAGA